MTIMEMLKQSAALTVLGVGMVFGFLILLIIAVTLMGKFIRATGLDKDIQTKGAAKAATTNKKSETTPVVAAIITAVNEYQKS